MLHAVIRCAAIAALVGCTAPTHEDAMLSASRISIAERSTVRVHASVDSIADLTIDAPATVAIVPITDGVGPGFDVTPSCDAARGADADLVVHVVDRKTGRKSSVVLVVIDDQTDACAANVAVWVEPCADDVCASACMDSPGVASIALAKMESVRICMSAAPLDSARPLTAETFAIEPATSAFDVGPSTATTRSIIVHGRPWLVGPYSVRYGALAAGLPISKLVPLIIGDPGDIGIEPPPITDMIPAKEFARTLLPLVVHRFPEATADCELSIETAGASAFECARKDVRLYVANGGSVERCTPVPCGPAAHEPFTLAFVPGIASLASEGIPLSVASGGLTTTSSVTVDVTSRAEDLQCAYADRVACADLDGDGVLEVILSTNGGTPCIAQLPLWRASTTQTVESVSNARMLTIPRAAGPPAVLAIAFNGDLVRVGRKNATTWSWTPFLTGASVPTDASPISSTGGIPDFLVGIVGGSPAHARFVRLTGGAVEIPLAAGAPVEVGALTNGDHDDLGIASVGGAVATYMIGSTLPLDWSNGLPKGGAESGGVGTGIQPGGFSVVERRNAIGEDLLLLSDAGPFSSAVAELAYSPASSPTLALGLTYGAVRSVATTYDGGVLLGTSGGAQLTAYDPAAGYATYRTIDPVPPSLPNSSYGEAITTCLDASGNVAGYAWQTGVDSFRVTQPGITTETP